MSCHHGEQTFRNAGILNTDLDLTLVSSVACSLAYSFARIHTVKWCMRLPVFSMAVIILSGSVDLLASLSLFLILWYVRFCDAHRIIVYYWCVCVCVCRYIVEQMQRSS